jgi:hypothetical protein
MGQSGFGSVMSAVARDVARAQRQAEAEERRRLRELERVQRDEQRARALAEKEML